MSQKDGKSWIYKVSFLKILVIRKASKFDFKDSALYLWTLWKFQKMVKKGNWGYGLSPWIESMDWVHELSFEGNGSEEILDKELNNSQKIIQTWKRHQEFQNLLRFCSKTWIIMNFW